MALSKQIFNRLTGPFNVGIMDVAQKKFMGRLFYPSSLHCPTTSNDKINDSHPRKKPTFWHSEVTYLQNYEYLVDNKNQGWKHLEGIRLPETVFYSPEFELTGKTFPLIVHSHGLFGNRFNFSSVNSTLASHGFVVLALEHNDGTANVTFRKNDLNYKDYRPYDKMIKYGIEANKFDQQHFLKRKEQMAIRNSEVLACLEFFSTDLSDEEKEKFSSDPEKGYSEIWPTEPYHIKNIVDVKTTNPILMGHSFGAASNLNLRTHPNAGDYFSKQILLDPWTFMIDHDLLERLQEISDENYLAGENNNLTVVSQEFADNPKIISKIKKIPNQKLQVARYSNHFSIGSDFALVHEKLNGKGFLSEKTIKDLAASDPDFLNLPVACTNAGEIINYINLNVLRFLHDDDSWTF